MIRTRSFRLDLFAMLAPLSRSRRPDARPVVRRAASAPLALRLALPCALRLALLLGVAHGTLAAQPTRRDGERRDSTTGSALPGDVARELAVLYNAPGTTRVTGRFEVPADRTVDADVAVLDGPVVVTGHIRGRLTAINADVTFRPGARVDGDVFVAGGVVNGRDAADLRGELRIYGQPLNYRREQDRIVAEAEEAGDLWHRWRWRRSASRRTSADLTLTSGRTYNRVEGLPILFGPSVTHRWRGGRLELDALGIFRTAEQFRWDSANVGHDVRGEVQLGRRAGLRLGGRLYDEVAPVEEWQLGAVETGLAAFAIRRDYRDYYNRHGGTAYATLFAGPDATFRVALADQRWASRDARDVFTLFRNNGRWRDNPEADEGRLNLFTSTLRVDTRNDEYRPWAGWYVELEYERGAGTFTRLAPTSGNLALPGGQAPLGDGARDLRPGRREYGRGFVDVRRYNRLGPDAQLNLRAVLGGWLHGDDLPLQRRLSVTGPGALAGFDFRRPVGGARGADVGLCSVGGVQPDGSPAQCERIAMAQVEYRGDIRVGLFGDEDSDSRIRRRGWRSDATWVVFADAGRGWLVGERGAGDLVYERNAFPSVGTFLSDVGVGIDFGQNPTNDVAGFGLYVAKSLSRPSQPANVFVRVRRRF